MSDLAETLIVECPNCASRYKVKKHDIGQGCEVRCNEKDCKHVWFYTPPLILEEMHDEGSAGDFDYEEDETPVDLASLASDDKERFVKPPLAHIAQPLMDAAQPMKYSGPSVEDDLDEGAPLIDENTDNADEDSAPIRDQRPTEDVPLVKESLYTPLPITDGPADIVEKDDPDDIFAKLFAEIDDLDKEPELPEEEEEEYEEEEEEHEEDDDADDDDDEDDESNKEDDDDFSWDSDRTKKRDIFADPDPFMPKNPKDDIWGSDFGDVIEPKKYGETAAIEDKTTAAVLPVTKEEPEEYDDERSGDEIEEDAGEEDQIGASQKIIGNAVKTLIGVASATFVLMGLLFFYPSLPSFMKSFVSVIGVKKFDGVKLVDVEARFIKSDRDNFNLMINGALLNTDANDRTVEKLYITLTDKNGKNHLYVVNLEKVDLTRGSYLKFDYKILGLIERPQKINISLLKGMNKLVKYKQ